jgi:RNA polymerase sigma-70 factor (ECF subfamily)
MSVTADLGGTSLEVGLVTRAQAGDLEAFDALIASRLDRCYRLAWSILSDASDAADAVQEACVSAWRDLPRLREPAAFDGWLNRIVANRARSIRRSGRRRVVEIALPDDPDTSGLTAGGPGWPGHDAAEIAHVVDTDVIIRAFDRLTDEQRALLVLHHVEHTPLADIAQALDIPVGTAKSRLHTARRLLEAALEAES